MSNIKTKTITGIQWFILSLFISSTNDLISKYLVQNFMSSQDITFYRLIFSFITLLPFVIKMGMKSIHTKFLKLHILRGMLLFIATVSWNYALTQITLPTATLVSFAIPIFTLILGSILLKEKISIMNWMLTFFMFVGLSITLCPYYSQMKFQTIFALCSVICFSLLDVLNKKFTSSESYMNMIFYSALFAAIFSIISTKEILYKTLSYKELILLLVIGINANLLLYCLLKAFTFANISTLSPYRYLELIISSILSYLVFADVIDQYIKIGTFIIIPTTYIILKNELQKYTCKYTCK